MTHHPTLDPAPQPATLRPASSRPARARRGAIALAILVLGLPASAERPYGPAQHSTEARHGLFRHPALLGRAAPSLPGPAWVRSGSSQRLYADRGAWVATPAVRYRGGPPPPPRGRRFHALPAFATLLTIGALSYYIANDVTYRRLPDGGYEVVDPPIAEPVRGAASPRVFVYPRLGQSAELQARDEYECHGWAVTHSGFDPALAALGQLRGSEGQQRDHVRANAACMDGRGYTLR